MPNDKTETVPIETDGLCTTVTGIIMKEGDKIDEPTGDLIFSMRDTSGNLKGILNMKCCISYAFYHIFRSKNF